MPQHVHVSTPKPMAVAQTTSTSGSGGGVDAGYLTIKVYPVILETRAQERIALHQEQLPPRIIPDEVENSRRPRIVPAQDRCLILVFMVGHIWTRGQLILSGS